MTTRSGRFRKTHRVARRQPLLLTDEIRCKLLKKVVLKLTIDEICFSLFTEQASFNKFCETLDVRRCSVSGFVHPCFVIGNPHNAAVMRAAALFQRMRH